MDDLSLKPKQPEKEPKQTINVSSAKVSTILLFAVVLVSLLSFYLVTINKMKDDKLTREAVEAYKDSVKTVIKIDTVYVPGKITQSNFDAYYDVSDCNTIRVTVTNGVVEVVSEDCNTCK